MPRTILYDLGFRYSSEKCDTDTSIFPRIEIARRTIPRLRYRYIYHFIGLFRDKMEGDSG